ncbi:ribonuclease H [Labilibaculum sp.]|uniref:ribonuclease H family protein n=1 Tax=Labilibaculum sp. TaxID=2060723 RepID=UPI0035669CD7
MKAIKIGLQIQAISAQQIECLLSNEKERIHASYFPEEEKLVYTEEFELTATMRIIEFQFKKVLRSAINGKLQLGQKIECVFFEDFPFVKESDFKHYIRVDRRCNDLKITTSKTGLKEVAKIFADGSHASELNQSAYAGFIEMPAGNQQIYSRTFDQGSSNMMELLAVLEGLEMLQSEDRIQVNTDSRFVIRGLAQWIHFWQHNNWQTAQGQEVKFANYWQKINRLCEGKLMEFKWIKGHSGHEKQDFCHQLAHESAIQKK